MTNQHAEDIVLRCEKCGKEINPKTATWLEHHIPTHRFVSVDQAQREGWNDKENESQGCFPFGPCCKKNPEFGQ